MALRLQSALYIIAHHHYTHGTGWWSGENGYPSQKITIAEKKERLPVKIHEDTVFWMNLFGLFYIS